MFIFKHLYVYKMQLSKLPRTNLGFSGNDCANIFTLEWELSEKKTGCLTDLEIPQCKSLTHKFCRHAGTKPNESWKWITLNICSVEEQCKQKQNKVDESRSMSS